MDGKIALEEHFAIDDTIEDSNGFLPAETWLDRAGWQQSVFLQLNQPVLYLVRYEVITLATNFWQLLNSLKSKLDCNSN